MEIPYSQNLPSEKWRRLVNEYAGILPDAPLKLKFTRNVLKYFHKVPNYCRRYPHFGEIVFREMLSEEMEKLLPGSRALVRKSMRKGKISRSSFALPNIYRFRHTIFLLVIAGLIGGLGIGATFLYDVIHSSTGSGPDNISLDRSVQPVPVGSDLSGVGPIRKRIVPSVAKENEEGDFPRYIENPIWLVEKTASVETYSNRLQIITSFSVENIPRSYVVFPKNSDTLPGKEALSTEIRGILYHASEGDMAPLKPEKNRLLKQYSNQLLQFAGRQKGYHYLIDRFGRIYRIVREEDAAFHAGNAVWADENSIFLNLNHAFIGICFEGKGFEEFHEEGSTKPKIRALDDATITEAQIRSGKELTDWLRFHYKIPEQNCVPHGITSVYPRDKLIGYHLDLAHGFPFHRFGLRNKYGDMFPSITEFGFKGDRHFREVLNGNIWPGINRSEEYLKSRAKQGNISLAVYRKQLNQRFDRYSDWQTHLHE